MSDKLLTIVTGILFALGVGCIIYVLVGNFSQERSIENYGNLACVERTQVIANTEESMAGIIPLSEKLKVLHKYYACNKIKAKDLVLFQFSKSIPPVVRMAQGLPGDKFTVTKNTTDETKWNVSINGQQVTGTAGPYVIQSKNIPPLKTYEVSRRGVLGENEYIIFADKSPSISDSSNLGIVKYDSIVGRAFPFDQAPGN